MSTQINAQMVDLDPTAAAFLTAYIEAKAKQKEWAEKADIARQQVEAAMGECEIALVNGREAVRWTTVETHRIDTKRIREMLPEEMVAKLETTTITRRFSIVDED
jgi:predicted phage-related endonuclease